MSPLRRSNGRFSYCAQLKISGGCALEGCHSHWRSLPGQKSQGRGRVLCQIVSSWTSSKQLVRSLSLPSHDPVSRGGHGMRARSPPRLPPAKGIPITLCWTKLAKNGEHTMNGQRTNLRLAILALAIPVLVFSMLQLSADVALAMQCDWDCAQLCGSGWKGCMQGSTCEFCEGGLFHCLEECGCPTGPEQC